MSLFTRASWSPLIFGLKRASHRPVPGGRAASRVEKTASPNRAYSDVDRSRRDFGRGPRRHGHTVATAGHRQETLSAGLHLVESQTQKDLPAQARSRRQHLHQDRASVLAVSDQRAPAVERPAVVKQQTQHLPEHAGV